jgi:TRAP-type C4-dicarboxylate transport system permease large subunit
MINIYDKGQPCLGLCRVKVPLPGAKGVAKDIPIGTIYGGVMPFVLATLVAAGIIFVVPSLATWLPGLLK